MKQEQSAGVIAFHRYDSSIRYLLLCYSRGNYWDLPKGKIEQGETLKETALRELKEETGLTANLLPHFEQSISYIFSDGHQHLVNKQVTFFVGEIEGNDPQVILSYEHIDYTWLDIDHARTKVTYGNARQVLEMADSFIRNYYQDK